MSEEDWMLEMCSGRAAWTVVPSENVSIELAPVAAEIEAAGWTCTLRNRLCYTFSGEADLTLYPSGKLLVKCEARDVAAQIGRRHMTEWILAGQRTG